MHAFHFKILQVESFNNALFFLSLTIPMVKKDRHREVSDLLSITAM